MWLRADLANVEIRIGKLEDRQYETKPIWEQALAAIAETNQQMREGFAETNQRIAETNEQMREGFAETDQRIAETNQRMREGFAETDQRIC